MANQTFLVHVSMDNTDHLVGALTAQIKGIRETAVFVWISKLFQSSIMLVVKHAIFQTLSNCIIKKVRILTFFISSSKCTYLARTLKNVLRPTRTHNGLSVMNV